MVTGKRLAVARRQACRCFMSATNFEIIQDITVLAIMCTGPVVFNRRFSSNFSPQSYTIYLSATAYDDCILKSIFTITIQKEINCGSCRKMASTRQWPSRKSGVFPIQRCFSRQGELAQTHLHTDLLKFVLFGVRKATSVIFVVKETKRTIVHSLHFVAYLRQN